MVYSWLEYFLRSCLDVLEARLLPGQAELEIESLEGEVERHPLDVLLHMRLGLKHLQAEKWRSARKCFQRVRAINSDFYRSSRAQLYEGIACLLAGKPSEALKLFNDYRNRRQGHYLPYILCALCNYLLRDVELAYKLLEQAETLERSGNVSRMCRALFLENDRRYDEASSLYKDIMDKKVALGELARSRLETIKKREEQTSRLLRKKARIILKNDEGKIDFLTSDGKRV